MMDLHFVRPCRLRVVLVDYRSIWQIVKYFILLALLGVIQATDHDINQQATKSIEETG